MQRVDPKLLDALFEPPARRRRPAARRRRHRPAAARRRGDRPDDRHRRLRQGRPAHRAHRRLRDGRGLDQAAQADARRRRGGQPRNVFSGIQSAYQPEQLVGKLTVDGRQPGAAQDEVRRQRRHGAGRLAQPTRRPNPGLYMLEPHARRAAGPARPLADRTNGRRQRRPRISRRDAGRPTGRRAGVEDDGRGRQGAEPFRGCRSCWARRSGASSIRAGPTAEGQEHLGALAVRRAARRRRRRRRPRRAARDDRPLRRAERGVRAAPVPALPRAPHAAATRSFRPTEVTGPPRPAGARTTPGCTSTRSRRTRCRARACCACSATSTRAAGRACGGSASRSRRMRGATWRDRQAPARLGVAAERRRITKRRRTELRPCDAAAARPGQGGPRAIQRSAPQRGRVRARHDLGVFSDQVLHAAMGGQHMMEQTFYLEAGDLRPPGERRRWRTSSG